MAGDAARAAAQGLTLVAALFALGLRVSPAGAGCCQYSAGCYDTDSAIECSDFGTFFPSPSTCQEGMDPPTCSGGVSTTTTTTTTLVPPVWPGFDDGRLSPDPGEYYAVWCTYDQVNVWRSVPESELIKTIPLVDVIALDVGVGRNLGDFMTAERSAEDTVTIYGSNGNRAPEAGSKSFSLSECVDQNGGPPDAQPAGPAQEEPSTPEEETEREAQERREREAREATENCYDQYEFFGYDAELLLDCLDFVAESYGGIGRCWVPVFRFRITGTFDDSTVRGLARGEAQRGQGSAARADGFNFLALYLDLTRVRDGAFAGTPGGRRATQLYYDSNPALLDSARRNPAVLAAGRDALEAWAPIVRGLTRGDGTAPTVSATQVRAFDAFLEAVRRSASPELQLAIEREVLLVDPASFEGLTPAQMVERLDRLSCEAAPTLPSLRCRLGNASRIVGDHLDGKTRRQLASRLTRATKKATRAEGARPRKQRRLLRGVGRLLGNVERKLGKKRIASRLPADVGLVLGADVAALRADAGALARNVRHLAGEGRTRVTPATGTISRMR